MIPPLSERNTRQCYDNDGNRVCVFPAFCNGSHECHPSGGMRIGTCDRNVTTDELPEIVDTYNHIKTCIPPVEERSIRSCFLCICLDDNGCKLRSARKIYERRDHPALTDEVMSKMVPCKYHLMAAEYEAIHEVFP